MKGLYHMLKTYLWLTVVGLLSLLCIQGYAGTQVIPLLEGEGFWGGCVTDGRAMPFGKATFERDLYGNTGGNQAQPLLISNKGRYIWSEEPFNSRFSLKYSVRHFNMFSSIGKIGVCPSNLFWLYLSALLWLKVLIFISKNLFLAVITH
jgi:hypothetical protein